MSDAEFEATIRKSVTLPSDYADIQKWYKEKPAAVAYQLASMLTFARLNKALLALPMKGIDEKFSNSDFVETWLKDHADIVTEFGDAERTGWAKFCRKGIFRFPEAIQRPQQDLEEQRAKALEEAWKVGYVGDSWRLLENIARKATTDAYYKGYAYTNQISIVQSSGMGKSRTVDQLARALFTFSLNLRSKREEANGSYPPPDISVRVFFLHQEADAQSRFTQATRYLIFFAAMFETARKLIISPDFPVTTGDEASNTVAKLWRSHILPQVTLPEARPPEDSKETPKTPRSIFFESVIERYTGLCHEVMNKAVPIVYMNESKQNMMHRVAAETANAELDALRKGPLQGAEDPIILYFDEVHGLHDQGLPDGTTFYHALCTAIDRLDAPAFAMFLSTKPRFARFAAPTGRYPSDRPALVDRRLAPFTELPFDCYPNPIKVDSLPTLERISSVGFMVRFGRPLFWTYFESSTKGNREKDTLTFAEEKLCNGPFRLNTATQERKQAELAVFALRLLLEFEPLRESPDNDIESTLVENYLRLVYSVPQHGRYMHSGYSSEPILAEVASRIMQAIRDEEPEGTIARQDRIARLLYEHLNTGLVTQGEIGELVGRLILILAIDKARETLWKSLKNPDYPRVMNWSVGVALIAFMKAYVGEANYEACIANSVPDNCAGVRFKVYFKDSVVRYTHFARAGDDSGVTTHAALAAFLRGAAILCAPGQEATDITIGVLIDKTKPISESNMTVMHVWLKNVAVTLSAARVAVDATAINSFPPGDTSKRAYIVIVMEMGVQPRPPPSKPTTSAAPPLKNVSAATKRKASVQDTTSSEKLKPEDAPSPEPHSDPNTLPHQRPMHMPVPVITSNTQAIQPSARVASDTLHPRYTITIRGCSERVYGVIGNRDIYAQLLHSRMFLSEHTRKDTENIMAVQRLKPRIYKGESGYHWITGDKFFETEYDWEDTEGIEAQQDGDFLELEGDLGSTSPDSQPSDRMVM